MNKHRYTHTDGEEQIITARFTKKELTMIRYALFIYDDISMNEDNENTESDMLRKASYIIDAKCRLKGVSNDDYSEFVDKYIP